MTLNAMALVLIAISMLALLTNGESYCDYGSKRLHGQCYSRGGSRNKPQGEAQLFTWDEAEKACKDDFNGHLASIPNEAVNKFLKTRGQKLSWIGLKKDAGSWTWSDKSTYGQYVNWDPNQQDSDDLVFAVKSNKGIWIRTNRTAKYASYWCKYPTSNYNEDKNEVDDDDETKDCVKHIRDRCQDTRKVIMTVDENSSLECQELCLNDQKKNCKSFEYTPFKKRCRLYSDPVLDISDCDVIGGPQTPLMKTCEEHGCQDFYVNHCHYTDTDPYKSANSVQDHSFCENLCGQESLFCAKWVLNETTCNLYTGVKPCFSVTGPPSPSLNKCL